MAPGLYQAHFESAPSLTLLTAYTICFYKKSSWRKLLFERLVKKRLWGCSLHA